MRLKLNLGFFIIMLLLWAICVYSILSNMRMQETFIDLRDDVVPGTISMSEVKYKTIEIRAWTLNYIIRGNVIREGKTLKEALQEQWAALEREARKHLEHARHIGLKEQRAAEKIVDLSQKLISLSGEVVDLKDRGTGTDELFEKIRKEFGPVFYPLRKMFDEHTAEHLKVLSEAQTRVYVRHKANVRYIILLGIGTTLLAISIGFLVDRLFIKYITERKHAEEELQESEERFRNIYENALVGIYRTTPDGRILMANPVLVRMLGFSSFEELAQRNLEDKGYEPQYDRSVFKERIEREGQISGLGSTWLKPDGTTLYFRENARTVCNNAGDILYYDGTVEDITELRRAEEKLQQYATDLEQSNKEIKQFAFIVSHDLRAPLVNLKGFSTELRSALEVINSAMNTVLPELDKKQQSAVTTALQEDVPEALDFIESSVSRMDNFISSVLKLSRLGRRELKFETVNMNMLVQDILKSLAHQIEERKTKVMVKSLPDVLADQVSMELIMGNILTNAVLYLDPNRSGEIEVTAERSSNGTIFSVRDNGCGIAKKDMDKVFTPFRRVGKVDVPGEGMGLSYVQTLVRRHSGHIWYDSKPGVGTTFSFTIANQPVKGNSHD